MEQKTETVELSEKKIEQLSKQPIIESFVSRSQDGKCSADASRLLVFLREGVVHKTVITDIVNADAFTGPQSPALRTSSR